MYGDTQTDYDIAPPQSKNDEFLKVAREAAQIGGEILLTHLSRVKYYNLEQKGEFDYATLVDHTSEKAIVEHIRNAFPDHAILAEEGGSIGGSQVQWIIDPLDGTTNYLHDVRVFAVSIAAVIAGEPVAGVIFDPVRNEIYTATKGGGAFMNGARLHVSVHDDMADCLLATGFPFRKKELITPYLQSFQNFFGKCRDIRRMGAAAIDLAYVAGGRFDGFWELNLNKWDIAAGVLLIQEAGGFVSGFTQDEDFWETGNIVATNGRIHHEITSELGGIFG